MLADRLVHFTAYDVLRHKPPPSQFIREADSNFFGSSKLVIVRQHPSYLEYAGEGGNLFWQPPKELDRFQQKRKKEGTGGWYFEKRPRCYKGSD